MDTDQELKLDSIARHLGVRIMRDLRDELHQDDAAGWFPQSRRVLYRNDMPYRETLCAVAHELAHAFYGDEHTVDPRRDARQEARADRWAACALITEKAYREAESIVGSHAGALAAELNVTVEFIHIWRECAYAH